MLAQSSRKGARVTRSVSLVISLESRGDGSLVAVVRTAELETALRANDATLELSIWRESNGVVRARLQEQEGGRLCYLQGNEALSALGDALGLEIVKG
jgi:hypothetical protein